MLNLLPVCYTSFLHITKESSDFLRCQNGISSWGGTRKAPYAFTEQGVAMLSGVLNSDRAIGVNIQIMRVFTQVRQTQLHDTEIVLALEEIRKNTTNHSKNLEVVFNYLDQLLETKQNANKNVSRKLIGFKAAKKKQ
jgi:hypothetical protein